MEFDVNLVKVQGTLYSFRMQGFLNNPDAEWKVIQGIKEITESLPEDAKAKVTYFMVLRTEFSTFEKFKNDEFIGHYLSTAPDFKKEYLITYVYHLNLQVELFKVIENSPAELGVELLKIIIEKLKDPLFHSDKFGYEHILQLWKSVFVKICKLDIGYRGSEKSQEFSSLFKDITDLVKNVLMVVMSSKHFEGLVGFNLYNFFKSLLFFINLHNSPNVNDNPLYNFGDADQAKTSALNFYMKHTINDIFLKIPNILMNLTVDMWMNLSETYLDSDQKNSVQILIGDLVYQILKEVKGYNLPSEVLNILSSISINKLELMAKADINEVICNIENGEINWFPVLTKHSAFLKEESLECLITHLEFASSEDLNVILSTSYECLRNEQHENLDLVKTLFLNALNRTPNYTQWLEKIFEKYQPNLLTTATTLEELIETFNKISKDRDISDCTLISLCVQAPLDTIRKICNIPIYGSEQTKFAINILKLLIPACNVSVHENYTLLDYVLLQYQLDEVTEKEKQSFINLVAELGKENLLGSLFFKNLLRTLREYLEKEIFEKAVLCLDLLQILLEQKSFPVNSPPLFVFMSQVLEHFSWDPKTFLLIKTEGRDIALSIITFILSGLGEDGPNLQWARQEILKSGEVNQASFCDLWFKFNYNWSGSKKFHSCILALAHSNQKSDKLRKFLINCDEPPKLRASIILSLSMLLPVSTFREWNLIFDNLLTVWKDMNSEDASGCVLEQFGSALQLAFFREREMIHSCYEYCLRNYGKMAKQRSGKITEKLIVRILEMIFILVGMFEEEERRKRCWEIFTPVLMGFVDRLRETAGRKDVEKLLPFIDLKDVAEALLNKLQ